MSYNGPRLAALRSIISQADQVSPDKPRLAASQVIMSQADKANLDNPRLAASRYVSPQEQKEFNFITESGHTGTLFINIIILLL